MRHATIHPNGSSGEQLRDAVDVARTALVEAIAKVHGSSPNARDFYVQGNDAYSEAAREHEARLSKLGDVYRELSEIQERLQDQLDEIEERRERNRVRR